MKTAKAISLALLATLCFISGGPSGIAQGTRLMKKATEILQS